MSLLLRLEGQPDDIWITDEGGYRFRIASQLAFLVTSLAAFVTALGILSLLGSNSYLLFIVITVALSFLLLRLWQRLDWKRKKLNALPLQEALRQADGAFVWDDVELFTMDRNRAIKIQLKPLTQYDYPRTVRTLIKPSDADSLKAIASAKLGNKFRVSNPISE